MNFFECASVIFATDWSRLKRPLFEQCLSKINTEDSLSLTPIAQVHKVLQKMISNPVLIRNFGVLVMGRFADRLLTRPDYSSQVSIPEKARILSHYATALNKTSFRSGSALMRQYGEDVLANFAYVDEQSVINMLDVFNKV